MERFVSEVEQRHGRFSQIRSMYLKCLSIVLCMLAVSSCASSSDNDEGTQHWSPFHSQSLWNANQGSLRMDLAGFERGHDPGSQAEFEIGIDNRLTHEIDGTICAYLIDETSVVLDVAHFDLLIRPDLRTSETFGIEFPVDIERRAYGLAVVLEDWGAMVHTIRLGIPDDVAGPWLDARELSCD